MLKKIIFLILILIFLSPVYFFSWWKKQTLPVDSKDKGTLIFVVPQGWGADEIGRELKEGGLIRDTLAFKIMVFKEGIAKELQAGDFRLSPSMNLFEISQTLTHGTLDVWVTLPEGLRKEEIVLRLADAFSQYKAEFDSQGFLKQTTSLEGFLFPDTYLISKEAEVQEVIKILKDNFDKKYSVLDLDTNLTQKQIVILASLIEREAKHDKDRSLVAGILLKRLKKGWPLQVDATSQYAKANSGCKTLDAECNWWPKINSEDLQTVESPFNTYKNLGLPPSPICNPGLSSLKAAVNPKDSDYWYYLSDKSGNIHYAETLEEQEENIEQFLNP